MDEQKIRDDWQKFVESQIWEGENEYTKNIPVGNVADWWIKKINKLYGKRIIKTKNK